MCSFKCFYFLGGSFTLLSLALPKFSISHRSPIHIMTHNTQMRVYALGRCNAVQKIFPMNLFGNYVLEQIVSKPKIRKKKHYFASVSLYHLLEYQCDNLPLDVFVSQFLHNNNPNHLWIWQTVKVSELLGLHVSLSFVEFLDYMYLCLLWYTSVNIFQKFPDTIFVWFCSILLSHM